MRRGTPSRAWRAYRRASWRRGAAVDAGAACEGAEARGLQELPAEAQGLGAVRADAPLRARPGGPGRPGPHGQDDHQPLTAPPWPSRARQCAPRALCVRKRTAGGAGNPCGAAGGGGRVRRRRQGRGRCRAAQAAWPSGRGLPGGLHKSWSPTCPAAGVLGLRHPRPAEGQHLHLQRFQPSSNFSFLSHLTVANPRKWESNHLKNTVVQRRPLQRSQIEFVDAGLRNMDLGTLQAFQRELCCSICRNYLIDPVTIDCGHSFCRPCLCLLWEEGQAPTGCPVCGKIPQRTDFHTNIALKRLASLARQSRPHNINSSEKQICVLHEEEKGLFCEAEQRLLCGPCSESPEHEAHGHSPIGQAAEECREKLLKKMDPLWRSTQEMQNNLNQEISKIHSLMDYAAFRKGMIKYQYQKMRQFLLEEEQLHLGTLDREGEEIVRQLQDSEDLENILEWTELVQMEKPQPVKPELTSRPITGVLDMLNKFRVDDPLSKERASHYMNLSEDVRNVIFGDDHDGAPRESQRAENFAAWGAQAFSSGKHYWEVDVTHSSNWILGVCKDSRTANTNAFEEAFFLFSSKRNNLYSLSNIFAPLTHYVQRPLGQVGVFLDYDNTVVSFYDVSKGSLIYSFFPSSLSSLLTPFFCIGSP
uniref:tripartite motif-containing protein 64-like n=1 Tax=Macaca mulatta TaxID=9544 RepID=UPI0010A2528A|nr:tripartite motif-containing protein 64-like [Macaca mulatta]